MSTVLWFTGLSGAGKTTIANRLKESLEARGKRVDVLDGDVVRDTLHKNLGFTPEDIKENNRLISELAKERMRQFDVVLVPVISPFVESRKRAKDVIGESFVELYVNCPKATVIERDTKGLYEKAKKGEIENLIGYHTEVPYEAPEHSDIEIKTDEISLEDSVAKILHFLETKQILV